MSQRAQFVDLQRTYLPIDPAALPENLTTSDSENAPEKRIPVMAYEGHNFMPTAQGYRSYFGLGAHVDLGVLADKCDFVFVYQRQDYTNFFIALCADGIWTNANTSGAAWVQAVNETVTSTEVAYLPWSYCVIGPVLYMYRQGDAVYYRIQPDAATVSAVPYAAYEVTPITPTFLNMTAQMGIFKAGGRLGFWDSDNSIAWSAFEDLTDFTPAVKTQANSTKFVEVVGRITSIRQHGDGFIIYSTKTILHVFKDLSNTFLWKTNVISNTSGVAYRKQIAVANPDVIHFAWTSTSLIQITEGKAEAVGTELYDYLSESANPILLSFVEGRYLFVEMMDADFLGAQVTVYSSAYQPADYVFSTYSKPRTMLLDGIACGDPSVPGMQGVATIPQVGYATLEDALVASGMTLAEAMTASGLTEQQLRDQVAASYVPAIPGITAIPAHVGTPCDEGRISAGDAKRLFNTIKDGNLLGPVATPYYRVQDQVWPEYPTGYIDCLLKPVVVSAVDHPIFEYPEHSYTYLTLANATMKTRFPSLYRGAAGDNQDIVSNLGISGFDGTNGINVTAGIVSATYIPGAVPAEVDGNNVTGMRITVTPADDVFGKAQTVWEHEKEWINAFVNGIKRNVYEHQDVTLTAPRLGDAITVETAYMNASGVETFGYLYEPQYVGGVDDGGYVDRHASVPGTTRTIIGTYYVPYSFKPEEYRLIDDVFHVHMELSAYEKNELIEVVTYSAYEHLGWKFMGDTYSSGIFADPATEVARLDALWGGTVPGGGSYTPPLYLGPIEATFGSSLGTYGYSVMYGAGTRIGGAGRIVPHGGFSKTISYSWERTIVFEPHCKLQYHAWIPPVYKKYSTYPTIVDLDPQPTPAPEPFWYCDLTTRIKPTLGGGFFPIPAPQSPAGPFAGYNSSITIEGITYTYPGATDQRVTFPSGSFLLQDGSPEPAYPLLSGSFVYDLHYKRWGKMKNQYYKLLDSTPINTESSKLIPYTAFGVQAAMLGPEGLLHSFDANPDDSYIKYGKVGITRIGMTSLEEIHAQFRLESTGYIEVETSLDGKTVDLSLSQQAAFVLDRLASLQGSAVGKWHNIALYGQYDLVYLEYRSFAQGRR